MLTFLAQSGLAQSGLAQSGVEDAVAGAAGIPIAFLVGMVSFFSPCILPLVPGYLSYMSGVSGQDLETGRRRGRVLVASLLFVLGFAIIFTGLGASASAFGNLLFDNLAGLERLAGVIVIVMGLIFLMPLFVRALQSAAASGNTLVRPLGSAALKVAMIFSMEHGPRFSTNAGVLGALPLGAAFGISWTPCVGPGLGTILTMALPERSPTRGAILLFAFSLGFGVWFVLGGVGFRKAMGAFGAVRKRLKIVTAVGGGFMITIGALMVTNTWTRLLAPLRRWIVNFAPPI